MITKPLFIEKLEDSEGIFSIMNFHIFRSEIYKLFDEKKIPKVFEKSYIHLDGDAQWGELIYKTPQSFYLHIINDREDKTSWYLTIYYKPENLNELIIFIRQVLKQLRDDTINN
jgi:hypothetical protein